MNSCASVEGERYLITSGSIGCAFLPRVNAVSFSWWNINHITSLPIIHNPNVFWKW